MSGRKAPHNVVIPASLFRYDKETKVFVGFFTELSQRHGHNFNTLVTIHNEKTHGEVVFEVVQVINTPNGDWKLMRFESRSKKHPDLKLVVLNE